MRPDPALVRAWLAARSVARGLPRPVADRGGLRVETGSPGEWRRYVFARPVEGIARLADIIDVPHVAIKLCGPVGELAALVGPRWRVEGSGGLMTGPVPPPPAPGVADGYRLDLTTDGPVSAVRILDADGGLAASGHAAEHHGVFAYDRIVTDPAHRRRGLGAAVMAALASARRRPESVPILVATEAGRALYRSLGWADLSPYSTATLAPRPTAPTR